MATLLSASATPLVNASMRTETLTESPVTPLEVAPPLSPPAHLRHGGEYGSCGTWKPPHGATPPPDPCDAAPGPWAPAPALSPPPLAPAPAPAASLALSPLPPAPSAPYGKPVSGSMSASDPESAIAPSTEAESSDLPLRESTPTNDGSSAPTTWLTVGTRSETVRITAPKPNSGPYPRKSRVRTPRSSLIFDHSPPVAHHGHSIAEPERDSCEHREYSEEGHEAAALARDGLRSDFCDGPVLGCCRFLG